jgi:hypothetical protein
MPRAKIRPGREAQEVGAAILATWFKVLPTAVSIVHIGYQNPLTIQTRWKAFPQNERVFLSHLPGEPELNDHEFLVGPYTGPSEFLLLNLNGTAINGADPKFMDSAPDDAVLTGPIADLEAAPVREELEFVLGQILVTKAEVLVDPADGSKIYVVVPRIPPGVRSRQDLLDYLEEYHRYAQGEHYHEELGVASLFGCK